LSSLIEDFCFLHAELWKLNGAPHIRGVSSCSLAISGRLPQLEVLEKHLLSDCSSPDSAAGRHDIFLMQDEVSQVQREGIHMLKLTKRTSHEARLQRLVHVLEFEGDAKILGAQGGSCCCCCICKRKGRLHGEKIGKGRQRMAQWGGV
jgi:hypothetical protein